MMAVPGSRPTGKRRKPAAAARILASGLATSGFFGIVATIAHQQASADARARQAVQAKAATQPQAAAVTEAPAPAPNRLHPHRSSRSVPLRPHSPRRQRSSSKRFTEPSTSISSEAPCRIRRCRRPSLPKPASRPAHPLT